MARDVAEKSMKRAFLCGILALFVGFMSAMATMAAGSALAASLAATVPAPVPSKSLQASLDEIVAKSLADNVPPLSLDRVRVALVDLADPARPAYAQVNGFVKTYPASVIKMIYLGYVFHLASQGKLAITPEVERQLYLMIHPSSNVATGFIVDLWSGVRHDALMSPQELEAFAFARNACNRWLKSLGVEDINANQKTWEGTIPDGERQFLSDGSFGAPWTNRNSMTAMAAARYLQLLAAGALNGPEEDASMRAYMRRDVAEQPYQARRIAGGAPEGAVVWSKSGTTTDTFHDAGIVRLDNGRTFILVVFIVGEGPKGEFIRNVSEAVCGLFEMTP